MIAVGKREVEAYQAGRPENAAQCDGSDVVLLGERRLSLPAVSHAVGSRCSDKEGNSELQ